LYVDHTVLRNGTDAVSLSRASETAGSLDTCGVAETPLLRIRHGFAARPFAARSATPT
jgi:hypothetical protein